MQWPSHRNRHPDNLVFFITNFPNHFSTDIINLNNPIFDQIPVLLLIGDLLSMMQIRPTITPGITNWNKFKVTIANIVILNAKLKSSFDVDQAIVKLSDAIQKSAMEYIKKYIY